jgi:A49-like RNA polymerase I associated factor
MKRYRVSEYVAVPPMTSSALDGIASKAPLRLMAASAAAGHPALVRFAPGASPPAGCEQDVTMALSEHTESAAMLLSATRPSPTPGKADEEWCGAGAPSYDYMIAIVDKALGTAKIVEAAGEYALSRRFAISAAPAEEQEDKMNERTYQEKRGDLLEEFGGKRARDRQAKRERTEITESRITDSAADNLTRAVEKHQEKFVAAGHSDRTTRSLAPPHNAAATRVQDAYPLIGLMTPSEYVYLYKEAETSTASADASGMNRLSLRNPGWHSIVWELMLNALGPAKDEEKLTKAEDIPGEPSECCRRLMAAMYLHYLITLNDAGSRISQRSRASLMEEMAVSGDILDCILDQFTEKRSDAQIKEELPDRFRSDFLQAKLIYFAVVFWLTASGFATEGVDGIAAALRITPPKLMIHITHIGGKVKRVRADPETNRSQSLRAVLSVPLIFPPISRRGLGPRKKK